MDLQVAAVDAVVVGDDHPRELDVLMAHRLDRPVQRGDDDVDGAQSALLERGQLVAEVDPQRVAGARDRDQPNFPVT